MLNYFTDFKNERFHDDCFIELITLLSQNEQLDTFSTILLDGFSTGNLINAWKKRDYDVHFSFQHCDIIIETKVDSGESNNQTQKAFGKYSKQSPQQFFLYVTYGLSEFYIKKKSDGTYQDGAFSIEFRHIRCQQMFDFIKSSVGKLTQMSISIPKKLKVWEKWLEFELIKRRDNAYYLADINNILCRYKATLNMTDYPKNRISLSTPEFAIPFYNDLCRSWNSTNNSKIGRATLYPIGRMYNPVNDSILNFSELWDKSNILTCGGLLNDTYLYFEFNEDFNLHLKAKKETPNIEEVKKYIREKDESGLLCDDFCSTIENYYQGVHVLYEWDLNVLSNDIQKNIGNIDRVISNTLKALC